MEKTKEFSKTESFLLRGKTFSVEVKHWHTNGYPEFGVSPEEHWCLYVNIGKKHPLFQSARKNICDYDTDLGQKIYSNWHGGCTYYNKQVSYVKIGCDYSHIFDEEFLGCKEMPSEVEKDARELFSFFEESEKQFFKTVLQEGEEKNEEN